jgi:hypothetical protein
MLRLELGSPAVLWLCKRREESWLRVNMAESSAARHPCDGLGLGLAVSCHRCRRQHLAADQVARSSISVAEERSPESVVPGAEDQNIHCT